MIERAIKRLEQRLVKILKGASKDKGVSFEETGIDQLFVDEAHAHGGRPHDHHTYGNRQPGLL
jgi:hypothetical protein